MSLETGAVPLLSTVNLAVALATRLNLRVGLLDGDVHGPSIAQMMNLHGKPSTSEGTRLRAGCTVFDFQFRGNCEKCKLEGNVQLSA
jgi:Mrp family chromosome partitioning ATPase